MAPRIFARLCSSAPPAPTEPQPLSTTTLVVFVAGAIVALALGKFAANWTCEIYAINSGWAYFAEYAGILIAIALWTVVIMFSVRPRPGHREAKPSALHSPNNSKVGSRSEPTRCILPSPGTPRSQAEVKLN